MGKLRCAGMEHKHNLNWREYLHWMEMVFGYAAPKLVQAAMPASRPCSW